MRDYTQHFYTIDDTPLIQVSAYKFYWFNTPEECQAFIDSFAGSSPGGGTLSPVAPAWFRWNKNLLTIWLNSAFIQDIGPNVDPGEKKQNVYGESPRNLGINSRVESKGFKATQTGNVILPDAIAQEIVFLQTFAAKLLKSRSLNDQRNGSIILSQLKQAFLGTQTFTQALINIQPILDQYK